MKRQTAPPPSVACLATLVAIALISGSAAQAANLPAPTIARSGKVRLIMRSATASGRQPGSVTLQLETPFQRTVPYMTRRGLPSAWIESFSHSTFWTIPEGVARQLLDARGRPDRPRKVRVSIASNNELGRQIRITAGEGRGAVTLERTAFTGADGALGAKGTTRVQLGQGRDAKAYVVGRTSVTEVIDLRRGKVKGRATPFRSGTATVIDPVTLRPTNTIAFSPTVGADRTSPALSWLIKPTAPERGEPPSLRRAGRPRYWELDNAEAELVLGFGPAK